MKDDIFFYQSVVANEVAAFTKYREAFEHTFNRMMAGVDDATLYKMRFDLKDAEKLISPA